MINSTFRVSFVSALAQGLSGGGNGFFGFGGGSSGSGSASGGAAAGSAGFGGAVVVTTPPTSSLCPTRKNPTACSWCYASAKTKADCDKVANGLNGTDDAKNTDADKTGDDCLWYSDTNVCLNDEGA